MAPPRSTKDDRSISHITYAEKNSHIYHKFVLPFLFFISRSLKTNWKQHLKTWDRTLSTTQLCEVIEENSTQSEDNRRNISSIQTSALWLGTMFTNSVSCSLPFDNFLMVKLQPAS